MMNYKLHRLYDRVRGGKKKVLNECSATDSAINFDIIHFQFARLWLVNRKINFRH